MITFEIFRDLAFTFPEVTEEPHFEKISFRIKKKIFATFDNKNNRACIKLSITDQDVFASMANSALFPVDNKWGKQGWTLVELNDINPDLFEDALTAAYCEVAPQKLVLQVQHEFK